MGYLSLYRKWRPKSFDDLTGQITVVRTLKNAILNNRIAHAYLFCGPRGTGKTSTAKLFAKALNCAHRVGTEPCNQCFSCEQINSGRSVDVIEIDAASNRRIDEIRDLREKVRFSPSEGDYKVYIIDEVHMLTKEAFNALLKTLEEPPANVVFILATTEPHKILPTILSRCQRFDFGLLTIREIKERLQYICEQEGVAVTEGALNLIARTAEGGMRDAISILDQAIAFGGDRVTADDVGSILGKVEQRVLAEVVNVVATHDSRGALQLVNEIVDQGKDMNQFLKDLLFHFRDLLLIRECGLQHVLTDLPGEWREELGEQAGKFTSQDLLRILELLSETDQQLKLTSQPRLALEMLMIRLAAKETDASLTNLIHRLARLEELMENGSGRGEAVAVRPAVGAKRDIALPQSKSEPVAVRPGEMPERRAQGGADSSGDAEPPWHEEPATAKGTERKTAVRTEDAAVADAGRWKTAITAEAGQSMADTGAGAGCPKAHSAEELLSVGDDGSGVGMFEPDVSDFADIPEAGPDTGGLPGHGVPVISEAEMEKHWNVTMTLLQKSADTRKLRAFLLVAKPYRIVGDTLYVVYPASSTFHKTNAEKESELLERALKKVTGYPLKICCIFEGEEQGLQQAAVAADPEEAEADDMIIPAAQPAREDIHQDPIIQKALKIFGGKVIHVENE